MIAVVPEYKLPRPLNVTTAAVWQQICLALHQPKFVSGFLYKVGKLYASAAYPPPKEKILVLVSVRG
jgi:hypothetical protein